MLDAAVLFQGPLNIPDAAKLLRAVQRQLPELVDRSNGWIGALRGRWRAREAVFDWLSRYRTLLGAWSWSELPWPKVVEATRALVSELGLTPEVVKEGIRETLLVLHNDWQFREREDPRWRKPLFALQQDIEYALRFWETISGETVDLDDPFWGYPEDHWRRHWTPLPDALPREDLRAKLDFPRDTGFYVRIYNSVAPEPHRLDEPTARDLLRRWWPHSVALRRLVLAFARMHAEIRDPPTPTSAPSCARDRR